MKRMLIDASHPEETRVVVLDGSKVEEFDFEAASKRPLKGNIYLAKVTRVEPSLQAAFVEYGGNRQGFLAFAEIHPDYYQIPAADPRRPDRRAGGRGPSPLEDDIESFEISSETKRESGEGRGRGRGRSRREGEAEMAPLVPARYHGGAGTVFRAAARRRAGDASIEEVFRHHGGAAVETADHEDEEARRPVSKSDAAERAGRLWRRPKAPPPAGHARRTKARSSQ